MVSSLTATTSIPVLKNEQAKHHVRAGRGYGSAEPEVTPAQPPGATQQSHPLCALGSSPVPGCWKKSKQRNTCWQAQQLSTEHVSPLEGQRGRVTVLGHCSSNAEGKSCPGSSRWSLTELFFLLCKIFRHLRRERRILISSPSCYLSASCRCCHSPCRAHHPGCAHNCRGAQHRGRERTEPQ